MKKKYRNKLLFILIALFLYLIFLSIKQYNSEENIEKRCLLKFQKNTSKAEWANDKEWNQIMDIAEEKFFKCIKIP